MYPVDYKYGKCHYQAIFCNEKEIVSQEKAQKSYCLSNNYYNYYNFLRFPGKSSLCLNPENKVLNDAGGPLYCFPESQSPQWCRRFAVVSRKTKVPNGAGCPQYLLPGKPMSSMVPEVRSYCWPENREVTIKA
jgi:hypothetical protein